MWESSFRDDVLQCPLSGRSRWPELAASDLSLKSTNDAGRTRAGLGPGQCRCPLWAAIGKLTRSTGPKQSPEGLLSPAAVGTTRRALRAAMPTAGSRFAARRASQAAWSMPADGLQAARQTIACDGSTVLAVSAATQLEGAASSPRVPRTPIEPRAPTSAAALPPARPCTARRTAAPPAPPSRPSCSRPAAHTAP